MNKNPSGRIVKQTKSCTDRNYAFNHRDLGVCVSVCVPKGKRNHL